MYEAFFVILNLLLAGMIIATVPRPLDVDALIDRANGTPESIGVIPRIVRLKFCYRISVEFQGQVFTKTLPFSKCPTPPARVWFNCIKGVSGRYYIQSIL
jgi:hypothetical protein